MRGRCTPEYIDSRPHGVVAWPVLVGTHQLFDTGADFSTVVSDVLFLEIALQYKQAVIRTAHEL